MSANPPTTTTTPHTDTAAGSPTNSAVGDPVQIRMRSRPPARWSTPIICSPEGAQGGVMAHEPMTVTTVEYPSRLAPVPACLKVAGGHDPGAVKDLADLSPRPPGTLIGRGCLDLRLRRWLPETKDNGGVGLDRVWKARLAMLGPPEGSSPGLRDEDRVWLTRLAAFSPPKAAAEPRSSTATPARSSASPGQPSQPATSPGWMGFTPAPTAALADQTVESTAKPQEVGDG